MHLISIHIHLIRVQAKSEASLLHIFMTVELSRAGFTVLLHTTLLLRCLKAIALLGQLSFKLYQIKDVGPPSSYQLCGIRSTMSTDTDSS